MTKLKFDFNEIKAALFFPAARKLSPKKTAAPRRSVSLFEQAYGIRRLLLYGMQTSSDTVGWVVDLCGAREFGYAQG